MTNNQKLLSTKEVAEYLSVTVNTVKLWLKSGKIKGKKVGRDWRINPDDLREFIPEGLLYGFSNDENLKNAAKIVHPEAWTKVQEYVDMQHYEIEREHILNEIHSKYLEEIPRRFPYPYDADEVITYDENGQPRYGKDEEVYQHYYKIKLKEEKRKLEKLLDFIKDRYGVQDADTDEIKRTIDNILILRLAGYE